MRVVIERVLVKKVLIDGTEIGLFELPDEKLPRVLQLEVRNFNDMTFEVILLQRLEQSESGGDDTPTDDSGESGEMLDIATELAEEIQRAQQELLDAPTL